MTKEKKLYLTAGFLSIVSILLGFIAFSIIIVCTPLHTLPLKGNSTHEYKLYDYEDPIVPIIEDPNQVSLLKDFHSALESFPEYTFLEKINQSLDIQYFCGSESFAPDNINIFEHDGTNYITVNQLLLNKEAFNAERIPLHCGNGFDETSYIVSPDYHISVILGSNYLKYFNIGDVISALNYYEVPTYMVVQGFAEKGACATVNGVTIDLDNYIITASPLFNFMPESFDETRYHGLLYFQKIDSYFMLKKASNIVDIIAGLDNISTANNMFPMYIQAYSPYYQMYIRFICRQPLVVDIFLFVLLLLGALICQCYIIHLSRAVTSKCFDLKLLLFYPFFDFCMILFFFILGELMSMNKDFLISASLILTLTFIFLSDIALIILFQSKSKSQISLCQK